MLPKHTTRTRFMPPSVEFILVNRELLLEVIEVLAEVLIRFL